jgi:hypothetical protein
VRYWLHPEAAAEHEEQVAFYESASLVWGIGITRHFGQ